MPLLLDMRDRQWSEAPMGGAANECIGDRADFIAAGPSSRNSRSARDLRRLSSCWLSGASKINETRSSHRSMRPKADSRRRQRGDAYSVRITSTGQGLAALPPTSQRQSTPELGTQSQKCTLSQWPRGICCYHSQIISPRRWKPIDMAARAAATCAASISMAGGPCTAPLCHRFSCGTRLRQPKHRPPPSGPPRLAGGPSPCCHEVIPSGWKAERSRCSLRHLSQPFLATQPRVKPGSVACAPKPTSLRRSAWLFAKLRPRGTMRNLPRSAARQAKHSTPSSVADPSRRPLLG